MIRTRTPVLTAGALLALSAALAPEGHAQAAIHSAAPRAEVSARADQLHREALSVVEAAGTQENMRKQLRRAARLHMHSAVLRSANDPQASACLQKASHLLHGSDPAQASALMESAGEHAHARGDVVEAARSYLDAASVVVAKPRVDEAEYARAARLIERARLLSGSPLLTDGERASLIRLMEPMESVAHARPTSSRRR